MISCGKLGVAAFACALGIASSCAEHPADVKATTPIAKTPIFTAPNAIASASATPDPSCSEPIDPQLAKKILDALFPAYLTNKARCRPHASPNTWTEVDTVKAANLRRGQFVPTVFRNERSDAGSDNYVIEIDNCQSDILGHVVFVSFAPEELSLARPKPLSRRDEQPGPSDPKAHLPLCADAGDATK
jgi:hypothetical protein